MERQSNIPQEAGTASWASSDSSLEVSGCSLLRASGSYIHQHGGNACARRSPTPLALRHVPSPGPTDALMTPGRLARSYLSDFDCCRKHPERRRRPWGTQGGPWPWCMEFDRTWGRGRKRNMFFWWICLLFSQGFVFHSVQGELPFMSRNNAAMLVNWWVERRAKSCSVSRIYDFCLKGPVQNKDGSNNLGLSWRWWIVLYVKWHMFMQFATFLQKSCTLQVEVLL